jgi:hypothetical protein
MFNDMILTYSTQGKHAKQSHGNENIFVFPFICGKIPIGSQVVKILLTSWIRVSSME